MLFHIASSPNLAERIHGAERRTTLEGFDFMTFVGEMTAKEKEARSKAQVIELLRQNGDRFAKWLEDWMRNSWPSV